jgi:hypothetical protein
MYRRMLFVGLGGSGGKTLRVLKRDLRERLNDAGWDGPIPKGWQFVHIDAPTVPDGLRKGGGSLDESEYLGLIGEGVDYYTVEGRNDHIPNIDRELLGWRVDGQAVRVPLTMGLGQFRALGRAVALCYAEPIKERLSLSMRRLNNPDTVAELGNLYEVVNGAAPVVASPPPIVVVVSSLAGGTGAGLVIDVCDILRSLESTWASKSIALLYTPEVFLSLPSGDIEGIQPNSLAAISEVLNGLWWHGGMQDSQVPRKTFAALRAVGLPNQIPHSGPYCSYLIGSTSAAGVQFTNYDELFETVGAALVSWVSDKEFQQEFIATTIGNWEQSARGNQPMIDVLVNTGSAPVEPGFPAFSALGFSRVSLGLKFLERYSSRRIAKDAAMFLVNAHLTNAEAQAMIGARKVVDPEQLANELADRYLGWFLDRSLLEERGPEKNQIVECLTPSDSANEWNTAFSRAKGLSLLVGSHPIREWAYAIDSGIEQATEAYFKSMTRLVQDRVNSWITDRPRQILAVVEEAIARFGLRVAAAIVRKSAGILRDPVSGIVGELRVERDTFQSYAQASRWQEQVRLKLDVNGNSKIDSENDSIDAAITEGLRYSLCVANAHICDRSAALVDDFAGGFLSPLARSIEDAANLLDLEIDAVNDWPNWATGLPPQDLCPPRSEWTLIEPEEFASIFTEKLADTFSSGGDRSAVDDHQRKTRDAVISGGFIRMLADQSPDAYQRVQYLELVAVTQSWAADFGLTQKPEPRREAIFKVRVSPDQLSERATEWLNRPGTPFQLLLATDLRTYTAHEQNQVATASPTEYEARRRQFIEKFTAAINAASPLVGLDPNLTPRIHPSLTSGGSVKFKRDVSLVPFRGHPLEEQVETLLETTCYAGRGDNLQRMMVGSSKVPYIDIISQLDNPVSPLVVQSLMRPISQAWAGARDSGTAIGSFWSMRRGRNLREFVPVPQEHLAAMIRGWFTGKLLGLIRGELGQAISIVRDPRDPTPRWVTFPHPTLTEARDRRDQLPVVLESLTLAYAEVGTAQSLAPLMPYQALRDFGSSMASATSELYSYKSLNPVLRQWLRTGEVPNAALIQNYTGARKEICASSEEERRSNLEKFLTTQIHDYNSKYESHLHAVRSDRSLLGRAPFWPDLKDEIVRALEEIKVIASIVADDSDF